MTHIDLNRRLSILCPKVKILFLEIDLLCGGGYLDFRQVILADEYVVQSALFKFFKSFAQCFIDSGWKGDNRINVSYCAVLQYSTSLLC